MKAIVALLAGLLVAGAFVLSRHAAVSPDTVSGETPALGIIAFDPTPLDLGPLAWGSEIPVALTLHNGSETATAIESIDADCGCVDIDRASAVGFEIAPGAGQPISFILHVGQTPGTFAKHLRVLLADGSVRTTEVLFEVYATYEVSPTVVDFGAVQLDQSAAGPPPFREVAFRSETVKLTAPPRVTGHWLRVALSETADETLCSLVVDAERLTMGVNVAQLRFQTDDPGRPEFVVPVRVDAQADVRPVPPHVVLDGINVEQVRFIDRQGQARAVASVVEQPAGLVSDWRADEGVLAIRRDAAAEAASGWIRVRLADGRLSQVRVVVLKCSR